MPDPDVEIRVGVDLSSKSWDKEQGGGGGGAGPQKLFWALGPAVWAKNKGEAKGLAGPSPGSATAKCYYRQVFGAKLGIAVHEWIRETLSWVDPHTTYSLCSVFPWYNWCKLSELLKYSKYQLTERWLEGKLEGFFGVSKQNVTHRIRNSYEISGFLSLW